MNTLEMISRIQPRQKAKAIGWDLEVICEDGIVVLSNGESSKFIGKHLPMTEMVLNQYTWKLEPISIGFSKAYTLLKEGKEVRLYTSHDRTLITLDSIKDSVMIEDYAQGTWYDANDVHSIVDLEW